jgi:hypothetical protein
MTYFAPCFNCAADKVTCLRRAEMRKAVKGLGVTSAKFKCPERQSKFRTGQRVEFDWRYYDDGYSEYGIPAECFATFYGTIMREKPGNRRFSIRVDQSHEDYDVEPKYVLKSYEFTSARSADIRSLDEPDKPMCGDCGAYREAADCQRLCYDKANHADPLSGCWKGRAA